MRGRERAHDGGPLRFLSGAVGGCGTFLATDAERERADGLDASPVLREMRSTFDLTSLELAVFGRWVTRSTLVRMSLVVDDLGAGAEARAGGGV